MNILDYTMVAEPQFRGAPYPPFRADFINISKVPDEARLKYFDVKPMGNGLQIVWITQEDVGNKYVAKVKAEIKRCLTYRKKMLGITDKIQILLCYCIRDDGDISAKRNQYKFTV